jgi:hypothetical protein
MTESRGGQGFEVAPQRLGGRGGAGGPGRRLVTLLVLGAAIAVVGAAWVGPRLGQRPNLDIGYLATPTPRASAVPSAKPTGRTAIPGPTALPPLTRPPGVTLDGHLALISDRFRVLDLATGSTAEGPQVLRGQDAVVAAADGTGWTCICFVDDGREPGESLGLDILRIEPDGRGWRSVGSGGGAAMGDVRVGSNLSADVDLAADRRRAVIATAKQLAPNGGWTLAIRTLDLTVGRLGDAGDLGIVPNPVDPRPAPSATPSPNPEFPTEYEPYLDGPNVRVAPDGRSAYVWATAQRFGDEGIVASEKRAWRITLDDRGAIADVAESTAFIDLVGFCWTIGFISDDRLAWACPQYGMNPEVPDAGTLSIRILDGAGRLATTAEIPNTGSFEGTPLIDRSNGMLYFWSALSLTLTRIDLANLDVVTTSFDPAATSAPGITTGGDRPPDWQIPDSVMARATYRQLAGEPGGSRLFLVGAVASPGYESRMLGSLGILVVDGSTLALLDRWAPAANYMTLAHPAPGLVAAIGAPGADVDGRAAPWLGSITIHDSGTGAILGRYAQFAEDTQPWIIESAIP